MAAPEYQIAALWMEGKLSFLEQLCLKSFVDAGHHVKLYHYGLLENVPEGIELADAAEILPRDANLAHARTGSPALHSDLFRYHLLAKNDRTIWADTDAYCMKPFTTETGHFFGWESRKHINGGVLGLPQDSDALAALLEFTSDEFAIPPFYGEDYMRELEEKKAAGTPVHASEQPWGVWGPHAVTWFLHQTGEAKHALPQEALYPFPYRDRRKMLKPRLDVSQWVTENTVSVHLYGRRMRARLVEREGGAPHPKSFLGELLRRHGINPADAPLPPSKAQLGQLEEKRRVKAPAPARAAPVMAAPLPPQARRGRGLPNLADLAAHFGSDKGPQRHGYAEIYQMLFAPLREREIALLELGLQNGGPEQGESGPPDDLPSVRMWLEFFPKGQIYGLDVRDFSFFEDPQFTFLRCDLEDRAALAEIAAQLPALDIVIDDASHASHHQQHALLALWDKLAPGGVYAIESLRWQPAHMERKGFTKTADLLWSYRKSGVFEHSDPALAEAFNALRADISGCLILQAGFDKGRKDQLAILQKR